ncbi:MAG: acetyl-CoA carboxylase biotin carboxyl carrier protein subunit [Deltaproteobacteria bacterium]|nr:MAG: acetyl-CoA carboxylase biotin carboxyl carrier protein subunit [Deltaproteobacteria bacterium]
MQRQIDLLGKSYTVTITGEHGAQQFQVDDDKPCPAVLIDKKDGHHRVHMGGKQKDIQMAVKGETAYIHAFGRTFTLDIVDPVEQASQKTGKGSNSAMAPMPGMVVDILVTAGDKVVRGQDMITIESMKILTVITAPRDGKVATVNFEPGKTFDKNDVLVTLIEKEDA